MSIERVGRWFAMGFRIGEDGKPESTLPLSVCENEFQRLDMRAGYAEARRMLDARDVQNTPHPPPATGHCAAGAHIQFWLVSGDWKHEDVEREIFKHEDTKGEN